MKEQREYPELFESVAIKSALYFEKKLDEWSKTSTVIINSQRRSKGMPLAIGGVTAAAIVLAIGAAYWSESNLKITRAEIAPRQIETTARIAEVVLPSMQTVATFRGGLIVNYIDGFQFSLYPALLEKLSQDPRVGINQPFNRQGFTFVLPIQEVERPLVKRTMEAESEKRSLLVEYDRQQNLRSQGMISGRAQNVAIPFYEILRRVYGGETKRTVPLECFYRLVELELVWAWVEGMKAVALGSPDLPIMRRTLSDEELSVIGNYRPLPFKVYSLDPIQVEAALGISYGSLRRSGSCG